MDNNGLTHFDGEGNAIMVDVSGKDVTSRTATAKGSIHVNREVMDAVVNLSLIHIYHAGICQIRLCGRQHWKCLYRRSSLHDRRELYRSGD